MSMFHTKIKRIKKIIVSLNYKLNERNGSCARRVPAVEWEGPQGVGILPLMVMLFATFQAA